VKRILPEMLRVAQLIYARTKNVQFLILESGNIESSLYQNILKEERADYPTRRLQERGKDLLYASDFAIVSSGTATLEAALVSIPFVILYKTAWSTFFLGRWLIQIPYIGLVNVVAGRKIVPEFIQHEIRAETIAQEAAYLLEHQDLREKMILDLKEVQSKLGPPGAARRAAEAVLEFLGQTAQEAVTR
jgi:lipid-A-disaccharide synthase